MNVLYGLRLWNIIKWVRQPPYTMPVGVLIDGQLSGRWWAIALLQGGDANC